VANVFLCRSERASTFSFGLFSNPLILVGILTELVLILLLTYTPIGNRLFGTAPISGQFWLLAVPFAGGMLVLEELRKRVTTRATWPASGTGSNTERQARTSGNASPPRYAGAGPDGATVTTPSTPQPSGRPSQCDGY